MSLPSILFVHPASANPGLTVSNAILVTTVSPGQTLNHVMTVSISSSDQATDIAVQVEGMTQSPDGTLRATDSSQDTSPYSARQFIQVDKSSFHLDPGGSQDVTAIIQVPQSVGAGGRYAMINIITQATKGVGVNFISAVNVPIFLTIQGSQPISSGKITDLTTGLPVNGQPVNILTTFQNTGNVHFKVKGEVTVSDAKNAILGTVQEDLITSSIVPTMSRQLKADFIPKKELGVGVYTVKSKIMLDDGTLLDESTGSFEVKQTYTPPASTPEATSSPTVKTSSSSATSQPKAGTNWALIVGSLAGVIIVVLIILLLLKRKK